MNTQSFLSIIFYLLCSQTCTYTNKFILSNNNGKADALFVTWFQNFVEFFLILFLSNPFFKKCHKQIFPPLAYSFQHFIVVFPCVILFVTTFLLNNKCMESLPLTSYQISRSLTILFNVLFTFVFLHKKTTLKEFLCCLGVTTGFIIGIEGDIDFNLKGLIYGISSSLSLSLYSVFSRKSIDILNGNQFVLIEYIIPFSIIILSFFVALNQGFNVFFENHNFNFWLSQIIGGIFGTLINIASFACIKYTSPIIHCLTGTLNSCITTFVSYTLFEKKISYMKLVGNTLTILFTFLYGIIHSDTKTESKNTNFSILINENENEDSSVLTV